MSHLRDLKYTYRRVEHVNGRVKAVKLFHEQFEIVYDAKLQAQGYEKEACEHASICEKIKIEDLDYIFWCYPPSDKHIGELFVRRYLRMKNDRRFYVMAYRVLANTEAIFVPAHDWLDVPLDVPLCVPGVPSGTTTEYVSVS